jgi:endogenous inhibitor of DNA gyrase (YacG/DUF329 family)
MASKDPHTAAAGRCPICRAATEMAYRPFCSARCRDVDLARWLGGGYAIAGGQDSADEDGDEAAAQRHPPGGRDDADDPA